jgi:large subunit ribosomal protein L25
MATGQVSSEFPNTNPFRSTKSPITGRWHDPKFSLRRQAELVKLARAYGVEELLPFTPQGTEEQRRKRNENGLRVKGTGIGQKVKGKEWERTMKGRYVLDLPPGQAAIFGKIR